MKISELTTEYLANYVRLDEPGEIEKNELTQARESAIGYVSGYTGLTEEQLDEYPDITQAVLILVADSYDNRNLYIEGKASNMNKAVESILNCHVTNFL